MTFIKLEFLEKHIFFRVFQAIFLLYLYWFQGLMCLNFLKRSLIQAGIRMGKEEQKYTDILLLLTDGIISGENKMISDRQWYYISYKFMN